MTPLASLHLRLFFTRGVALADWARVGNLARELALYRRLRPHLAGITLITHGGREDDTLRPTLGDLALIRKPEGWSELNYVRALRLRSLAWPRGRTILKSNQTAGADIPLTLAQRRGFPFIARCGYLRTLEARRDHGEGSPQARRAEAEESRVFQGAHRVVVTTPLMAEAVRQLHGVAASALRVIPNYVDTELFHPAPAPGNHPPRLLFVGRLDHQKNPLELVKAMAGRQAELLMVGDGPLREAVTACIRETGAPVTLSGNLPHDQLPALMAQADAFLMPSRHEGHPKALLEAMACGLPIIAGDVPGIREEIRHGVNGLLCAPETAAIIAALDQLLAHPEHAATMGGAAREWVASRYALERVAALELELLAELGAGP